MINLVGKPALCAEDSLKFLEKAAILSLEDIEALSETDKKSHKKVRDSIKDLILNIRSKLRNLSRRSETS